MPSTTNKKASTTGKKGAPIRSVSAKKGVAAAPVRKSAPKTEARKPAPMKAPAGGKAVAASKPGVKPKIVVKASVTSVVAKPVSAKPAATKAPPAKPAASKGAPAKPAAPVKTGKPVTLAPKAPPAKAPLPKAPAPKAPAPKAPASKAPVGKAPVAPAKHEARPASAVNGNAPKPASAGVSAGPDDKKAPAKGITVVQNKPMRKPKIKVKVQMPSDPLFKPGSKWKPLIPSGPNATPTGMANLHTHGHANEAKPVFKSKLTKKELEPYRKILLTKRSELVGDIAHMEDEALRQSSGSLSQLPQHMAEQGSDTFEQSLSLDLAAVDRSLIREIDDALKRIEEGTYGMCERTGKPINAVRLAELPWARYSIEAARELERRPYQE